jgi:hypothetical protein
MAGAYEKHRAGLQRWIRRLSVRSPRKADAPRTRKEPLMNSRAKKRASLEEKEEKHLAVDAGRAERIRIEVDRP